MTTYFFDSIDETQRLSFFEDLDLIQYNVDSKYQKNTILEKPTDHRFQTFSFFKAHGCSAYSLKVWVASTSRHTFLDKIIKPLSLALLPVAHSLDVLSSSLLGTFQLVVASRNIFLIASSKVLSQLLSEKNPIRFNPVETTAIKTYTFGLKSLFGVLADPFKILFYSWGDILCLGEWIYDKNEKKLESIVDQSKIDWIQTKYGPLVFEEKDLKLKHTYKGPFEDLLKDKIEAEDCPQSFIYPALELSEEAHSKNVVIQKRDWISTGTHIAYELKQSHYPRINIFGELVEETKYEMVSKTIHHWEPVDHVIKERESKCLPSF